MAENGRTYFDRQEVRDPNERERSIFHALPGLIRHAVDNAPFFREHLAGIDPDAVTSRTALAEIPLFRRSSLTARQQAHLPFGGLAATATARLAHLYAGSNLAEPMFPYPSARLLWRPGEAFANAFAEQQCKHHE